MAAASSLGILGTNKTQSKAGGGLTATLPPPVRRLLGTWNRDFHHNVAVRQRHQLHQEKKVFYQDSAAVPRGALWSPSLEGSKTQRGRSWADPKMSFRGPGGRLWTSDLLSSRPTSPK